MKLSVFSLALVCAAGCMPYAYAMDFDGAPFPVKVKVAEPSSQPSMTATVAAASSSQPGTPTAVAPAWSAQSVTPGQSSSADTVIMAERPDCRDFSDAAVVRLLKLAHILKSPGNFEKEAEYGKIMKTLRLLMPDYLRANGDCPALFQNTEQSVVEMLPVLRENLDEEWYLAKPEVVTQLGSCSSISMCGDWLLYVSTLQKNVVGLYHIPTKRLQGFAGITADFIGKNSFVAADETGMRVYVFDPADRTKSAHHTAGKDLKSAITRVQATGDRLLIFQHELVSCRSDLCDFKTLATHDVNRCQARTNGTKTLIFSPIISATIYDSAHSNSTRDFCESKTPMKDAALLWNDDVIASFEDGLRLYSSESKQWSELMKLAMSPAIACGFAQIDPQVVAVAYDDNTIAFWNVATKTPYGKKFTRAKSNGRIIKLEFKVDTGALWVAYSGGLVEKHHLGKQPAHINERLHFQALAQS